MTIYNPSYADGYEFCHPVDRRDFKTVTALINGVPRAKTWTPVEMQILRTELGKRLKPSDCPWYGRNALVFRERVVAALGPMLLAHGDLLPLSCKEADLVVFNPTSVLPAIDEDASNVVRWEGGSVREIKRYVFRQEVIAGHDIFKLATLRFSPVFVTEHFVDAWRSAGLEGVLFREARRLP